MRTRSSLLPAAVAIVLVAFAVASVAQAQDVTCRNGDLFRRIQVVIDDDQRGLPCEVTLWSSPTQRQTAWRAEFERGFCAEKARDMIERLIEARWRCHPTETRRPRRRPVGRQPTM